MRAELHARIGTDARGFLHNEGAVVSEALVPFGQVRLSKEGAIALESLGETTNGDADGVLMNPACQLPKFLEAQPTANSAEEQSGLACTGARVDNSSSQGSFQTLLTACTIWVQLSASRAPRLTPVC